MVRSTIQLSASGRSLTLNMALEGRGTDPVERATCEPILSWCVALWDDWLPRHMLLRTLGDAIARVQGHVSPWSMVQYEARRQRSWLR